MTRNTTERERIAREVAYIRDQAKLTMMGQTSRLNMILDAADRIDAILSATPDAESVEPVAWRWRHTAAVYGPNAPPGRWNDGHPPPHYPGEAWRFEVQPLFAHPPALPVGAEPSNLQKVQSASQGLGQPGSGSQPEAADSAKAALAPLYRKTALVSAEQFLPAENKIPSGVYSNGMGNPQTHPLFDWCLMTLEGEHVLRNGDYICTGHAGERWNVAREIFEATYELAAPTPPRAVTVSEEMVERAASVLSVRYHSDGDVSGFDRHVARAALTAAFSAPMGDQGALVDVWRSMETAPKNGPDFLAKNAKGDIRRCWRAAPSSRTDEIRTFTQQKFAAVGWIPLPVGRAAIAAQGGGE